MIGAWAEEGNGLAGAEAKHGDIVESLGTLIVQVPPGNLEHKSSMRKSYTFFLNWRCSREALGVCVQYGVFPCLVSEFQTQSRLETPHITDYKKSNDRARYGDQATRKPEFDYHPQNRLMSFLWLEYELLLLTSDSTCADSPMPPSGLGARRFCRDLDVRQHVLLDLLSDRSLC